MAIPKVFRETALTVIGSTPARFITKAVNASYNLTVASIGTNVVVRSEFSLDNGTTWTNCNTADTTITTIGQFIIPILTANTIVPMVRLTLVTITGGTPTVTPTLRFNQ